MKHINLISGPRNISTALMYSFAQRSDTTVLDEPYYALYLKSTGADHPGKEDVIQAQPTTEEGVHTWIKETNTRPVLFIKNMAHHMEIVKQQQVLLNMTTVFLIRNPKQIIASYAQVIEKPEMRDIGLEYQYHLFQQLHARNQTPVVLDSGLLLQNPKQVMEKLCQKIQLPFEESMLQWAAGPKPYDGVWAPHWYANVHRSTGFTKQTTSDRTLRHDLMELYERAQNYYEKLLPFAITP
jgi:hypothetical protein